jgi:hypothetical protein
MDMRVLYIELYVSFLLGIFVYVLYELFNVEKERDQLNQSKPAEAKNQMSITIPSAGVITIAIGLIAFCISAAVARIVYSGDPNVLMLSLVSGLLNPFVFVGVPLGIYWRGRTKQPAISRKDQRR